MIFNPALSQFQNSIYTRHIKADLETENGFCQVQIGCNMIKVNRCEGKKQLLLPSIPFISDIKYVFNIGVRYVLITSDLCLCALILIVWIVWRHRGSQSFGISHRTITCKRAILFSRAWRYLYQGTITPLGLYKSAINCYARFDRHHCLIRWVWIRFN